MEASPTQRWQRKAISQWQLWSLLNGEARVRRISRRWQQIIEHFEKLGNV
jgi:hypothetical protein